MNKDKTLRLALDAMEYTFACSKNQLTTKTKREYDQDLLMKAINSIKQALEARDEPLITVDDLEQEIYENTREFISFNVMKWMIKKFYTTPQRTWVGLTEQEIERTYMDTINFQENARILEDILKEKNI